MSVEHVWGANRSQHRPDALSHASAFHTVHGTLGDQVQGGAMRDSIKGSTCM